MSSEEKKRKPLYLPSSLYVRSPCHGVRRDHQVTLCASCCGVQRVGLSWWSCDGCDGDLREGPWLSWRYRSSSPLCGTVNINKKSNGHFIIFFYLS